VLFSNIKRNLNLKIWNWWKWRK